MAATTAAAKTDPDEDDDDAAYDVLREEFNLRENTLIQWLDDVNRETRKEEAAVLKATVWKQMNPAHLRTSMHLPGLKAENAVAFLGFRHPAEEGVLKAGLIFFLSTFLENEF